jgi:rSAM/selenodomain-associated transferase 2
MMKRLSIIVPMINEAALITESLKALSELRVRGHEVIVVDGGSQDGTAALCLDLVDSVIHAPRGRALQMNAGAAQARGEVLLFLHADTALPMHADASLLKALASGADWGRFDVAISGRSLMLPVIATLINWRSRWTGLATGDQAIFVKRDLFEKLGGFPNQLLMEDIELSHRLRNISKPACLSDKVITSGRRWEARGVWSTILLMWWLRLRYSLGASPDVLAKVYK